MIINVLPSKDQLGGVFFDLFSTCCPSLLNAKNAPKLKQAKPITVPCLKMLVFVNKSRYRAIDAQLKILFLLRPYIIGVKGSRSISVRRNHRGPSAGLLPE